MAGGWGVGRGVKGPSKGPCAIASPSLPTHDLLRHGRYSSVQRPSGGPTDPSADFLGLAQTTLPSVSPWVCGGVGAGSMIPDSTSQQLPALPVSVLSVISIQELSSASSLPRLTKHSPSLSLILVLASES